MSVDGNITARTHYPRRKQNLYQQMQELPKSYRVIALSSMSKVRAHAVDENTKEISQ